MGRLQELKYADEASFMDSGRVVVSGTADEVADYAKMLGAVF